jgi:hypothetical protein
LTDTGPPLMITATVFGLALNTIIHGVTIHDGYMWYCEVEGGRVCNFKL